MTTCEICGTEFDELGVQIVVPGLAKSFDRIDCAARARALAGPPARNVRPAPAVFVGIAPRGQSHSYGLHGLPAGLAAVLAGGRARLALGGASAAVAVLLATSTYLALRGDSFAGEQTISPVSPSPPRYGGENPVRARTDEARANSEARVSFAALTTGPSASTHAPPTKRGVEDDGVLVTVQKDPETKPPLKLAIAARTTTQKPKAANTRHARKTATKKTRRTRSVSTRRGWGWGDKNHAHGGPVKHAGSANSKAHGHKDK